MHHLPLTEERKQKEWSNITHIAEVNGYSIPIIRKLNTKIQNKSREQPTENEQRDGRKNGSHLHNTIP